MVICASHGVFQDWILAQSLPQLYEKILRTMELGYNPTLQDQQDAREFLEENKFVQVHHQNQNHHVLTLLRIRTSVQATIVGYKATTGY